MGRDYIDRSDSGFDAWQENCIATVLPNLTAWGIPTDEFNRLLPLRDKWKSAWEKAKYKDTRTSVDVRAKKEARKIYEKALRSFINKWIRYNDRITSADKKKVGLLDRDPEPTEKPKIENAPYVVMISKEGASILIRCRVKEDSTRASRHKDADAIEMRYKIGEPPPKAPEECPNTIIFTRAIHTIKFSINQVSMRIYAYFRWKNISDDTKSGPWSKRIQAIIAE